MSRRHEREKAEAQRLRDLFEGVKGRRPDIDQELEESLASPQGKAATEFELTDVALLSPMQFSVRIDDENKIERVLPNFPEITVPYSRCTMQQRAHQRRR